MTLKDFAKNELAYIGTLEDDGIDGEMAKCVLKLIDATSNQGHSGASIHFLLRQFSRLLMYKPLAPLTGEKDEWTETSEDIWINKRCPSVFKDARTGKAFMSEGIVWRRPDGACYTDWTSNIPVTFPFHVPDKPEYIDVDENGHPIPKAPNMTNCECAAMNKLCCQQRGVLKGEGDER